MSDWSARRTDTPSYVSVMFSVGTGIWSSSHEIAATSTALGVVDYHTRYCANSSKIKQSAPAHSGIYEKNALRIMDLIQALAHSSQLLIPKKERQKFKDKLDKTKSFITI